MFSGKSLLSLYIKSIAKNAIGGADEDFYDPTWFDFDLYVGTIYFAKSIETDSKVQNF